MCVFGKYGFIMLIYQLVKIKYLLDPNLYVHICVCFVACVRLRVCEWQHLICRRCALALILSQSHSRSWLPISFCWLVQSHQTRRNSVHLLGSLFTLQLVACMSGIGFPINAFIVMRKRYMCSCHVFKTQWLLLSLLLPLIANIIDLMFFIRRHTVLWATNNKLFGWKIIRSASFRPHPSFAPVKSYLNYQTKHVFWYNVL